MSASVRGASHLRSGTPNQDAVHVEVIEGGAILAVADGHGSDKCFRSHIGSRLAVEVAARVLSDFAAAAASLGTDEVQSHTGRELPREIVRQWRAIVQEHLSANPIAEAELPAAGQRSAPLLAYGATLVCVLLCRDFLLRLQLGDGEILTVCRDGGAVRQPMAADDSLIANETTSLCQEDAEWNFRVHLERLGDSPPALILLATDGYPNSFETPVGFRQVASDLLNMLDQDGASAVAEALPGWLDESSRLGSGDDVSVAILYSPPRAELTTP